MDTIEIEVRIDKKIDIDVRIDEIIDGINNCAMKRRWNYIGQIINQVKLDLSELTDDQKEVVRKYLSGSLDLFTAHQSEG